MSEDKKNIPGIKIAFYIVVLTEIMFFAGIISAYLIAAAKATDWPPIDQPRLPLAVSVGNVLILLSSAFTMNLFSNNAAKET
ncbi:MAG: cytochrome c oxidase subunit 3 [Saprospiraceae bacterium]